MKTIQVGSLTLAAGKTAICVPISGATEGELRTQANHLRALPVDLCEWRADFFEALTDEKALPPVLDSLRESLGGIPLLFTVRTEAEGGQAALPREAYMSILRTAAGHCDMVDVELFTAGECACDLTEAIHRRGAKVLCSSHDFHSTPGREDILARFRQMQAIGADLSKLAFMPQNRADVLRLMEATCFMAENEAVAPLAAMSMGELGRISRATGPFFASALTFAAVSQGSAPGQYPLEELLAIMNALSR